MIERQIISAAARLNHAPMLTRLPNGRLFACWYSGSGEARADVTIVSAIADAEGLAWSAPQILVAAGHTAIGAQSAPDSLGNPVPYAASDGRLWLIYGVIEGADPNDPLTRGWRCGRIDARWSDDFGATWSPSLRVVDARGALPRCRPIEREGELLLPAYVEGAWISFIAQIPRASPSVARLGARIGPDVLQPALVTGADGAVRAYFRDRRSHRVRTALYDADRDRWGELKSTDLPNPDSAIDATQLSDGRILIAYNPSATDRGALAFATSADGVRFRRGLVIADGPGALAYPAIALTPQGAVVVLYSARGKRDIVALRAAPESVADRLATTPG